MTGLGTQLCPSLLAYVPNFGQEPQAKGHLMTNHRSSVALLVIGNLSKPL
jgi:hypothetical protein